MDINETNNILEELKNKSHTHPNITKLWINYINIKKKRLEDALILASSSLSAIETTSDLSQENLTFLIIYMECLREITI